MSTVVVLAEQHPDALGVEVSANDEQLLATAGRGFVQRHLQHIRGAELLHCKVIIDPNQFAQSLFGSHHI